MTSSAVVTALSQALHILVPKLTDLRHLGDVIASISFPPVTPELRTTEELTRLLSFFGATSTALFDGSSSFICTLINCIEELGEEGAEEKGVEKVEQADITGDTKGLSTFFETCE